MRPLFIILFFLSFSCYGQMTRFQSSEISRYTTMSKYGNVILSLDEIKTDSSVIRYLSLKFRDMQYKKLIEYGEIKLTLDNYPLYSTSLKSSLQTIEKEPYKKRLFGNYYTGSSAEVKHYFKGYFYYTWSIGDYTIKAQDKKIYLYSDSSYTMLRYNQALKLYLILKNHHTKIQAK